jgi:hypothetical protein
MGIQADVLDTPVCDGSLERWVLEPRNRDLLDRELMTHGADV